MTNEQREELVKKMERLMRDYTKFNNLSSLAECAGMCNTLEILGYEVETNVHTCKAIIKEK